MRRVVGDEWPRGVSREVERRGEGSWSKISKTQNCGAVAEGCTKCLRGLFVCQTPLPQSLATEGGSVQRVEV